MATFPDVIGAPSGYQRTPQSKTIVTELGENHYTRYRKWFRERHSFTLVWDQLNESDAKTIEYFIISQHASAFAFDWFDWKRYYWRFVPIGIGDGATVTFDVPGKDTVDHSFRSGNTTVSGNVNHGTGFDGCDRVTLSAPPAVGQPVTASFLGRRRFSVTFQDAETLEVTSNTGVNTYSFAATLQQTK